MNIWIPEKWSPKNGPWEKWSSEKWSPRKMVPRKMASGKNGPRKNGPCEKWSSEKWSPTKKVPRKMDPGKNGPRKIGPRGTQRRKIVGWASSIVVCVECWDVINLWKPTTRQQTQNSETNPKHRNENSWGELRVSWCVCWMFGCDQSMKTQNSTTNLPGLL